MRLWIPLTRLFASLDPSGTDDSASSVPCSNCCRPGRPGSSSHAVALNPRTNVSSGVRELRNESSCVWRRLAPLPVSCARQAGLEDT